VSRAKDRQSPSSSCRRLRAGTGAAVGVVTDHHAGRAALVCPLAGADGRVEVPVTVARRRDRGRVRRRVRASLRSQQSRVPVDGHVEERLQAPGCVAAEDGEQGAVRVRAVEGGSTTAGNGTCSARSLRFEFTRSRPPRVGGDRPTDVVLGRRSGTAILADRRSMRIFVLAEVVLAWLHPRYAEHPPAVYRGMWTIGH